MVEATSLQGLTTFMGLQDAHGVIGAVSAALNAKFEQRNLWKDVVCGCPLARCSVTAG